MKQMILVGILALAASPSFAQTDGAAAPAAAPAAESPQTPAADPQAGGAGPANLCQELLAFMKTPPPETAAPSGPDKPAASPAGGRAEADGPGATPPPGGTGRRPVRERGGPDG